jgi:CBS domain containing-hemolysin-like protein
MIINGVLELVMKKATDAMTLLSDTFAIDVNLKLDRLVLFPFMLLGCRRIVN